MGWGDPSMTKDQAEMIATAVRVLRPEWPMQWVMEVLAHNDIRNRPMRQVVVAFMAVAADPDTKYPQRLHEGGDWWKAAAVAMREEPSTPTPDPIRSRPCPEHPDQRMTRCAHCRPATPTRRPPNYAQLVEQARERNKEKTHGE